MLGRYGRADLFAAFGPAIIKAHLASKGLYALDFHRGAVGRHNDDRTRAHQLGSSSHALCVVPGREGDDTASFLVIGQAADAIIGPAKFERPRNLKGLGLHKHAPAYSLVKRGMFDDRCANNGRSDLTGGINDTAI